MSDDLTNGGQGSADLTPPPPPPPPPPARAPRHRVIGRKGASIAVASGLVIGGVAGGYVISQAATPTPSATSVTPPEGHPAGGGGSPASRTEDEQQAAAALGITAAQLQTDRAAGKSIATIAKERNVDLNTVIATLVGDENAEIDAAAKAGTITSAQATQMKAQTTQRVTDMVNGTEPARGPGGPRGHGAQGEDQQVIATAIGISTTQLQTELTAGKTVAAIATTHGKTAAAVISALVASENAEIDQRAASGQISAAQAAQDKAMTQQRVTDMVNGTRPAGGGAGPRDGAPEAPSGSSSTS